MKNKLLLLMPLASQVFFTLLNPNLYSMPFDIPFVSGLFIMFLAFPTAPLVLFYPLFKDDHKAIYGVLTTLMIVSFISLKSITQYNTWRHRTRYLKITLATNSALYLCWWVIWIVGPELF